MGLCINCYQEDGNYPIWVSSRRGLDPPDCFCPRDGSYEEKSRCLHGCTGSVTLYPCQHCGASPGMIIRTRRILTPDRLKNLQKMKDAIL